MTRMSNARIRNKREYKAAIATLAKPVGARERTTAEIIARLNPSERHEIKALLRSMTLRKTIRRILYESFHRLNQVAEPSSMQRLRHSVRLEQLNEKLLNESNERQQVFTPQLIDSKRIVTP